MTDSQVVTLICQNCKQITNQIEVYEYYTTEFKRILENSTNYCLECYQKQKETQQRMIKETGEIKGFRIR